MGLRIEKQAKAFILADGVKEGGLEFIGSRIPSYKSKGKPLPLSTTYFKARRPPPELPLFYFKNKDGRVSWDIGAERGRPTITQYAASRIKPDRHIIKGLRLRLSPICTLSQNGYGDLERRRLYIL